MVDTYVCPVCGYTGLDDPPEFPDGGWSYEICPCCGFQFGVTDSDKHFSYAAWRERWISLGMPWDRSGGTPPPPDWDPKMQLDDLLRGN